MNKEKTTGNPLFLIHGQRVWLSRMKFKTSYLTTPVRKGVFLSKMGCGLVNYRTGSLDGFSRHLMVAPIRTLFELHQSFVVIRSIAQDSWIIPIHGLLIDPVTHRCGEKSTNRVKNPRVEWANNMERGDRGATERDKIIAWGLLNILHATRG